MADMASELDVYPDKHSDFAEMRDSLYILSVMNQYSIKSQIPAQAGEKLLRIALFSNTLQIQPKHDSIRTLVGRRKSLAATLRETRKRGVVPVFISLGWFLFSLALSIQTAFGFIGDNQIALNTALGLLLAWFPVFLVATIVDRNPVGTDRMRRKLNRFLDVVRLALLNSASRQAFLIESNRTEDDVSWTTALEVDDLYREGFFTQFAGQGRIQWHYGVAHPILAGMESNYLAPHGRNWLQDIEKARQEIIWGPTKQQGLIWFDLRMIWQMIGAFTVVGCTVFGAFILSYFTPTVGLGCRSGGYMIYFTLALSSFGLEMLIWWLRAKANSTVGWFQRYGAKNILPRFIPDPKRRQCRTYCGKRRWLTTAKSYAHRMLSYLGGLISGHWIQRALLRFFDVVNSTWLAYLVCAQTFGANQNCDCSSSNWGPNYGYVQLRHYGYYRGSGVEYYWGFGIGLSVAIMVGALIYSTYQYCTQSHLSSEDYDQALRGLRATRWFKRRTIWIRYSLEAIVKFFKRILHKVFGTNVNSIRRSLVWTP